VHGRVTYDGLGLRGIQITFLPMVPMLDVVTVVTASGGYYTADLSPAMYTVLVSQDTNLMGGEKYVFEAEEAFLPSGAPVEYSFSPQKKVEIYGYLLGAASDLELRFTGPETVPLTLNTTLNYSAYLLPGEYSVYVSGAVGEDAYANITSVALSVDSRQHDFQLMPASELHGTISIGDRPVSKTVTVTARSLFGETVEVLSTTSTYSIELPQGEYTVVFSVEDTKLVDGRTLYVEYEHESEVLIGDSGLTLNPVLVMGLDNTTLSGVVCGPDGTPVKAFVRLSPNSVYGLALEFWTDLNGAFSVSVQPGEYTVQVTRSQDKYSFLSTVSLERDILMEQSFEMGSGCYIYGQVLVDDAGESVEVSVASGSAKVKVMSDSNGWFTVLVPEGDYALSATTTKVEYDLIISYSGSLDVTVAGTDRYVILELLKDAKRSVVLSWDRNLTQTVPPGVLVRYAFTVTNTGNVADTWVVSSSTADFDIKFIPDQFELGLGSESQVTVVAEIAAQDNVPAGEATISALVRCMNQASARGSVSLYLNVSPVHSVRIASLNVSAPTADWSTITKFTVNNTGNVADRYFVSLANAESLLTLGWEATVVDPVTGEQVAEVELDAFEGEELAVRFTAVRSFPDEAAYALVFACSADDPSSSMYSAVPIMLPDMLVGPGDVTAERVDVSYEYDVSKLVINIALAMTLASLVLMFFALRKKKGLGKGGASR